MSQDLPLKVQKYLAKYGSTKWKLESEIDKRYDCAVVVPAIAEYENLVTLLNSLSENIFNKDYQVIIIFVINNFQSSLKEVQEDNRKSLFLLDAILKNDYTFHPVVNKFIASGLSIGFVDVASKGFEIPGKTGGVGLARKIGMDIALTVFDYSKPCKQILICLDSDCTVEKNYIQTIISSFNQNNFNAAVINYEHPLTGDNENIKAIICYEIFLRYYELGLKYAGSQYSFQTIGSAIACDYEAYIKIEGMNKQKAAEDFYFLEKLAKHYRVGKIKTTKVFPSPRRSWRVPFGTGQRINRFYSKSHDEYLLYDPESFNILKEWLELFHSEKILSGEDYLQKANKISPELCNFMSEQNLKEAWNKIISNSKDELQIKLQKHRWFDGFRTLKLIHHLRDAAFPLINMFDALDEMFTYFNIIAKFKRRKSKIPDLEIQKKYLYELRDLNTKKFDSIIN